MRRGAGGACPPAGRPPAGRQAAHCPAALPLTGAPATRLPLCCRYYAVRGEGRQYWRHARRPLASPDARPTEHDAVDAQQPEETLLDEDELAAGHSYFDLSGPEYSPDEALAAYGLDLDGSEVYTL